MKAGFSFQKVLVLTGGLITADDPSLFRAISKWFEQWKYAQDAWLDFKVKLVLSELLAKSSWEQFKLRFASKEIRAPIQSYFRQSGFHQIPSLTEIVLADLLQKEGLSYELMTLSELFSSSEKADALLMETGCVFLSSTYLHDLSELLLLVQRIKRPHNRIIVGGALAGIIASQWEGMSDVELLAIGYGEYLVPSLANWIRSGYQELVPPVCGRLEQKAKTRFLYSGVPESSNLDFLSAPDWTVAKLRRQVSLEMIYYESVRGCPYRCNFCNYPFLFDDTKFRYKSAQKMAADWEYYVKELGVRYIACLDSLFTMPKRRLEEFCRLLIQRKINVQWSCYARADDLTDSDLVQRMIEAGAHQVQIGIESGDATLLQNMNKACSVESNAFALKNCREYGLTSVVSLIVGFPGETEASLERTYQFLENTPPDFYFLATFSTRVAGVPLLSKENKARFSLEVKDNLYSMATYWKHETMSCSEVGNYVRILEARLMRNEVALNSALFHAGISHFNTSQRNALLQFQKKIAQSHWGMDAVFNVLHKRVDRQLKKDIQRHFLKIGVYP